MARYRLRFLLQEFDLRGREVDLGRSADCQITLEDPLVSRCHARIHLDPGPPAIEDLGSRNGVRVNGRRIRGKHELVDGDRIRLGTQELVFAAVQEGRQRRKTRPTGFMRTCRSCATPYPEMAPQCPHCGAVAKPEDEDTITGLLAQPKSSWAFQLLSEVIERALETGRRAEADRLLRRARDDVQERMDKGEMLTATQLAEVSEYALRLAALGGDQAWADWVFEIYQRHGLVPVAEVIELVAELCKGSTSGPTVEAVRAFVHWWKERGLSENHDTSVHLEQLKALMRQ